MGVVKILDPVAEVKIAPESIVSATYLQGLKGKRIGLISNEWRSFLVILERLKELFVEKAQVNPDFYKVEVELAHPAPKEVLDDFAKKCAAAIVGFAN